MTTIKELREKNGKRPCDCSSCDCGNSGNTYSVGMWDGADWILNELEKCAAPAVEKARGERDIVDRLRKEAFKEGCSHIALLLEAAATIEQHITRPAVEKSNGDLVQRLRARARLLRYCNGETINPSLMEEAAQALTAGPDAEGWKLVPTDPTEEMVTECYKFFYSQNPPGRVFGEDIPKMWVAMLSAAPQAPAGRGCGEKDFNKDPMYGMWKTKNET